MRRARRAAAGSSEPPPYASDEPFAEPAPGDVESPSLTGKALTGVASNWVGAAILIAAQIASTAVTARLVSPAEFGAYATAQVAAGVTGYFTLSALGPGLQRRSQLGAKTVGTAVTLSLIAAALVAAVLWVAAPLWARAWEIEDALWTIRALAIALFLTSLSAVPVAIISRRLQFRTGPRSRRRVILGLGAGVVLAAECTRRSPLLSARRSARGVACGVGVVSRDRLELAYDREDARELFAFASQVGGLGLFTYLTISAPSFFVARVFGASTLGLFSRANLIVVCRPSTCSEGSSGSSTRSMGGFARTSRERGGWSTRR